MKSNRLNYFVPAGCFERAIDFYTRAFALVIPNCKKRKKILLTIEGQEIWLAERKVTDNMPTKNTLTLVVPPGQLEKVFCGMVSAGAQVSRFITTVTGRSFRDGRVVDPFGHMWILKEEIIASRKPARSIHKDLNTAEHPLTVSHIAGRRSYSQSL